MYCQLIQVRVQSKLVRSGKDVAARVKVKLRFYKE